MGTVKLYRLYLDREGRTFESYLSGVLDQEMKF